ACPVRACTPSRALAIQRSCGWLAAVQATPNRLPVEFPRPLSRPRTACHNEVLALAERPCLTCLSEEGNHRAHTFLSCCNIPEVGKNRQSRPWLCYPWRASAAEA